MKFLLDHDVPENLSYLLEQLGHDIILLRKSLPEHASDARQFVSRLTRGVEPNTPSVQVSY